MFRMRVNKVAKTLKITAWGIFILGPAAALYTGISARTLLQGGWAVTALLIAAGAFLCGLAFYAAGEAVGILHDIRSRVWQMEPAGTEPRKPGLYVEDIASFKAPRDEPDPALEQVESFIWVCGECGEINLSSGDHCRICKAGKPQ
jgi:hypothetical protein